MLILHDEAYYLSRKPDRDLGIFRNFLRFIWNNERKSFLDRNIKEWDIKLGVNKFKYFCTAAVSIFYFFFFGALMMLFALQMWITLYHISPLDKPYFQYKSTTNNARRSIRSTIFQESPLRFRSPGIGFQPNIISSTSPIIWINDSHPQSRLNRYIESLTNTFQEYEEDESDYDPDCTEGQIREYSINKSCFFDISRLGLCGSPPYGYTTPIQPCVIIKFNKRFNWVPDCFNQTSLLPANMPEWLRRVIHSSTMLNVWLSCDGANNVDKEFVGQIDYFPISGFPAQYFPFNGRADYLAPMVALRFTNLTVNRLITVECTIWAKNIEHKRPYNLDFQIMINTL